MYPGHVILDPAVGYSTGLVLKDCAAKQIIRSEVELCWLARGLKLVTGVLLPDCSSFKSSSVSSTCEISSLVNNGSSGSTLSPYEPIRLWYEEVFPQICLLFFRKCGT